MAEYDLIERNKIFEKVTELYRYSKGDMHIAYRELLDYILDMPTADVQPVDRWVSVDEALPNSGETVLIYYNNQFYTAKYNGDFADTMPWSGSGHWWGKELISFWQPLPEPPNTTKG